ncbi:MAG: MmcQ/YjbR family DNA-binding protein [Acidobacteriota bacterium]|jgi:predicted DNA-binding protein (MmcQ/YjbR family)
MSLSWVRTFCRQLPGATEEMKWEKLAFCIDGKIFAILSLEPLSLENDDVMLCFKCPPEAFGELTELPGIIQAPYFARRQWVALEPTAALPRHQLAPLLRTSYELVLAKLPRYRQAQLRGATAPPAAES